MNYQGAYVDVRGPWPMLVIGNVAIVLEETDRGVNVDNAIEIARLQGLL